MPSAERVPRAGHLTLRLAAVIIVTLAATAASGVEAHANQTCDPHRSYQPQGTLRSISAATATVAWRGEICGHVWSVAPEQDSVALFIRADADLSVEALDDGGHPQASTTTRAETVAALRVPAGTAAILIRPAAGWHAMRYELRTARHAVAGCELRRTEPPAEPYPLR